MGLVAGLYMAIVGATGALLVFRPELDARRLPPKWRELSQSPRAAIGTVIARLRAAYPDMRVISLSAPTPLTPTFVATLGGRGRMLVASDPGTGAVLGPVPPSAPWLAFLRRLHETLLLGGSGRTWNGVGAACLLLLVATGLSNWWPGVRNWRHALKVGTRFGWRRITFDLHRAGGFWAVALLVCWAMSGVYFAWTRQAFELVNAWSPTVSARPPAVVVTPGEEGAEPDVDDLIARASTIDPGTRWSGLFFPYGRQAPIQVVMSRAGGTGREYEDTVYFDPYTGQHLATWRYGVNESLGDWFLWLQIPLHFGRSWGVAVKVIWAIGGMVLPLLAITGMGMYWNRVLRHSWARRSRGDRASPHLE